MHLISSANFPQVFVWLRLIASANFPQVFVGGKFIGGAADACVLWKKGELQPILEQAGAKPQGAVPGAPEWNGYSGDPFEVCASGHD